MIKDDTPDEDAFLICADIESLLALADDHIRSVDFNRVQRQWLQLYTDCALLLSILEFLLDLRASRGRCDRQRCLKTIQRLDRAIIISGAVGKSRSEWIQLCIREVQRRIGGPNVTATPHVGKALIVETGSPGLKLPSLFSSRPITASVRPPTLREYRTVSCLEPLIIRNGLGSDICTPRWPALKLWGSSDYLLSKVGEGRVVPIEVGQAYDSSGWTQAIVSFRTLLHRIGFATEADPDEAALSPTDIDGPWYLAQHDLFSQFPELRGDLSLPDYVWSDPWKTDLSTLAEPSINFWLGPGHGTVMTPAHTVSRLSLFLFENRLKAYQDPHYNCFAQVLGRKRVWVAPPEVTAHMYAWGSKEVQDLSTASEYMHNTSAVPVLRSDTTEALLAQSFPKFVEHAKPNAMEAVLDPGDLLMLPPGWWHSMVSQEDGPVCSVSIWF